MGGLGGWEASLCFNQEVNDWIQFERVMDMSEQEFSEEVERQEEGDL